MIIIRTVTFVLVFLSASLSLAASQLKAVPNKYVPGRFDVVGEPAGFNPSSPYVFVHRPTNRKLSPVLLFIHGGNGLTPGSRKVPKYFQSLGFATVSFDAFKMNRISGLRQSQFGTKLSLTAKQALLSKIAQEAFDWILEQSWAEKNRVYIYGHSNGARVALAMADKVQRENVPMIFSEAPAHCCIPLPGTLNVPVKLIFGDKDNWAGRSENDLLYERWSITNKTSTKTWAKSHQSTGKLEIKIYHGGHALFLGKGIRPERAGGTQWRLGGDFDRLKADIKVWVTKK